MNPPYAVNLIRMTSSTDHDSLAAALGLDLADAQTRLGIDLATRDNQLLQQLVNLRRRRGLSQQQVANRIKRHQSSVSQFETVGGDPRLSIIRRYAWAIGARITHAVVADDAAWAQTPTSAETPPTPPFPSDRDQQVGLVHLHNVDAGNFPAPATSVWRDRGSTATPSTAYTATRTGKLNFTSNFKVSV